MRWERRARKRAQAETAAQPRRRRSLRPQRGRSSRQASPPKIFSPDVTISRSGVKLCTWSKFLTETSISNNLEVGGEEEGEGELAGEGEKEDEEKAEPDRGKN